MAVTSRAVEGGVQGVAWFLGCGDVCVPKQAWDGVQRAASGALPCNT